MTIQAAFVGVHPDGWDVYDGWRWVAWFKTREAALAALDTDAKYHPNPAGWDIITAIERDAAELAALDTDAK